MIVDPKLELQLARCRLSLREIEVPEDVCRTLSEVPPLLMQFAHMCVFLEQDWKDALRWVYDHKWEIMAYSKGELDAWGKKIG